MSDPQKKIGQARALRKRMTPAERKLWRILKNRHFNGLLFTRQQPIEEYIADFYCAAARVVVELDGFSHFYRTNYDSRRDARMKELGIIVVRIPNHEVLFAPERVLENLLNACGAHVPVATVSADK